MSILVLAPPYHPLTFLLLFTTSEAYLHDKELTGKRKAGNEEAFGDDDDDDDVEEAAVDSSMPRTPAVARKSNPPVAESMTHGAEDDIDGLVDAVQASLNLGNWFKIDRSQEFAIFACVYVYPSTQQRYVYVRIELVGSINESMVKARLINDGDTAIVTIKIRRGGELTNPEHCVTQYDNAYEDVRFSPLYTAMMQVHRFNGEANEEEEITLTVDLPFRCEPQGFKDPMSTEEDGHLDLGIFPLDTKRHNVIGGGAPLPSTKFLHIVCEELNKAKLDQPFRTRSYFRSPAPHVPPTTGSSAMTP